MPMDYDQFIGHLHPRSKHDGARAPEPERLEQREQRSVEFRDHHAIHPPGTDARQGRRRIGGRGNAEGEAPDEEFRGSR
ncbi:hypothetical protein GGTG_13319 [Gaeumannomyces tritici R3-111a-1]|uniref:Uncharacterized protein n=1 Tax=Gaeumannomyces tritici (strain R3-111a-1) TaxID=644352 RepID=J3PIJ1_GAET3|nr:hypothetical protein GGTG_13319 [Gaeumannomyces tritici R3-111a-1]EJT69210.1 hypothetical protein GGTG_13319 [Gaeumannomyces tritici R3-111a-1]